MGQNGSGKSTLVRHVNGMLRPWRGRVLVNGQDTRATGVAGLARTVGLVFQNPDHQIFCATVRDEIAFGPRNLGLPAQEVAQRCDEALAHFGLERYADVPPALLGFGLRRVVSIAAVWSMRPEVFILDEPTVGLDWALTLRLMDLIGTLQQAGHTIILVTHDLRVAARFAERTVVLSEGEVVAHDDTRAVLGNRETLARVGIPPLQATELAMRLEPLGMPTDVLSVDEWLAAYGRLRRERGGR